MKRLLALKRFVFQPTPQSNNQPQGNVSNPHTIGLQPKFVVPVVPHPYPHTHLAILVSKEGLLIRPHILGSGKDQTEYLPCIRVSWGKSVKVEEIELSEKLDWSESVVVYGIIGILELFSCSSLISSPSLTTILKVVLRFVSAAYHIQDQNWKWFVHRTCLLKPKFDAFFQVLDPLHIVYATKGVVDIPLVEDRARMALKGLAVRNNSGLSRPSLELVTPSEDNHHAAKHDAELRKKGSRVQFPSHFNNLQAGRLILQPSSPQSSFSDLSISSETSEATSPIFKTLAEWLSFWSRLSNRPTTSPPFNAGALTLTEEQEAFDRLANGGKEQPAEVIVASTAPPPSTTEERDSELETKVIRECIREFTKGGMYFAYTFGICNHICVVEYLTVPLVINLHNRVAAVIQDGDVALVQGYTTAHAGDKTDTKVRTVADALSAAHAPAYNDLVRRIKAALGDDITLAHLCILDNVQPRATKPRKPTFISSDAFIKLTTVRHKHEAINVLVLGQLQRLDATIGDASCEERVPLVIDLHNRVTAVLQDGDMALVQGYITAHAGDKTDTKVRTVADALGAAHAPAYDDLVRRIEAALGDDITLARLCYTFTESGVWSKDEMNLHFSYRSKAPMDIAGELAQMTGNCADLINVEQDLRVDLAHLALLAFRKKVAQLPRYEVPIPNTPQFFIDNQLLLASEIMQSYIPLTVPYPFQDVDDPVPSLKTEQVELPVLPIFNQMLAIFYMMFNEGHGIIVRVCRNEMTPITDSHPKECHTQKFTGIYYLLFKPNHETGSFEVVEPAEDDMNCNFMVVDAWSKYCVGTNGTGLDAANLDEHRAALASSNLLWLILQYAATHPDYAAAAVAKNIDYAASYQAICMPQLEDVSFHPTREQFPELHLKVNIPNETRPNLHDLWMLARKHGEQRDLHDNCQAIIGPFDHDLYERINRSVDFQVSHIFAAPLKWIKADTDALIAKHGAAPKAVFGPIVVRIGDSCFSFVNLAKAHDVLNIKNNNRKRAWYREIHPENASFIKV